MDRRVLVGLFLALLFLATLPLASSARVELDGEFSLQTKLIRVRSSENDAEVSVPLELGTQVEALWSPGFSSYLNTGMDKNGISYLGFGSRGNIGRLESNSELVFGSPRNREGKRLGKMLFVRWGARGETEIGNGKIEGLFLLEDTNFRRENLLDMDPSSSYTKEDQNVKTGASLTVSDVSLGGLPIDEAVTSFSLEPDANPGYGFINGFYQGKVTKKKEFSQVLKLDRLSYLGLGVKPEIIATTTEKDATFKGSPTFSYETGPMMFYTGASFRLTPPKVKLDRFGVRINDDPLRFNTYFDSSLKPSTSTLGFRIELGDATWRVISGLKPGEGLRSLNTNASWKNGPYDTSVTLSMSKRKPEDEWVKFDRLGWNIRYLTTRHNFKLEFLYRSHPEMHLEIGTKYTYKF